MLKIKSKPTSASILLVGSDSEYLSKIETILGDTGYPTIIADSLSYAFAGLNSRKVDLIIADLDADEDTMSKLISEAKQYGENIEIILLASDNLIDKAVTTVKQGAFDFVYKSNINEKLMLTVNKALEFQKIRRELSILREEIAWKYSFDSLIGSSDSVHRLKSLAARIAESDIDILISGETGTGKELLARAIHYHSSRRKQKFVSIQCASIPENLIESELFGEVGNSTVVTDNIRPGLLESADGGTVFLDEIGDIPLAVQAKILKVIEESKIKAAGAIESKKVNIRFIGAASVDPSVLIDEGKLRNDLFYRLNTVPINIPSLCKRLDDIPDLVMHFIKSENAGKEQENVYITAAAMEKLLSHEWPGNVGELENTIKRAITLCRDNKITADDIIFITPGKTKPTPADYSKINEIGGGTLEESLKQRIEKTLYANNWNLTQTAVKLGIGRTTLWRKIKKYDLRKEEEVAG